MRLIALVAFKGLGVKLAFPILGHFEIFESARCCCQITGLGAVAIALAFGTVFSPGSSNEGIQLLADHQFQDGSHRALSQSSQVLVEFLLFWQKWS